MSTWQITQIHPFTIQPSTPCPYRLMTILKCKTLSCLHQRLPIVTNIPNMLKFQSLLTVNSCKVKSTLQSSSVRCHRILCSSKRKKSDIARKKIRANQNKNLSGQTPNYASLCLASRIHNETDWVLNSCVAPHIDSILAS